MFDLRSELLPLQAQFIFYKLIREFDPVCFGEGNMMCIEIARGTTEFRGDRDVDQLFHLVFYSFRKYHQFLAQSGGTGSLSMRMRQHRHFQPLFREYLDFLVQVQHRGQLFKFKRVFP